MKIIILGYGITGKRVIEFLKRFDVELFLYDKDEFNIENVEYYSYARLKKELPLFDLAIRSPGITKNLKVYSLIEYLSKKIISEIEFSLNFIKSKHLVCVTGSNGKTTTCMMINSLLKQKYHTFLLGNIKDPLITKVDEIKEDDIVIIELSSFMLENTNSLKPEIVVIPSLCENHLDVVRNYECYLASKKRILFNRPKLILGDCLSLLNENSSYYDYSSYFSLDDFSLTNKKNINYAIKCAKYYSLSDEEIKQGIKEIVIPSYRQQIIKKYDNFIFINDSKSTSIDSTNKVLEEYKNDKNILILEGIFKGKNINLLNRNYTYKIYSYGKMNVLLNDVIKMNNLKEILLDIFKNEKQKVNVIFSPMGSSFDLYKNYQERGKEFNSLVNEIWK